MKREYLLWKSLRSFFLTLKYRCGCNGGSPRVTHFGEMTTGEGSWMRSVAYWQARPAPHISHARALTFSFCEKTLSTMPTIRFVVIIVFFSQLDFIYVIINKAFILTVTEKTSCVFNDSNMSRCFCWFIISEQNLMTSFFFLLFLEFIMYLVRHSN